jgi:alanine racemase
MGFYHRVYAEINLDNIVSNYKAIKKIVGEKKEIIGVVKADGYGHGSIPVAKELQIEGVNGIAVAVLQEGIILRKYGIKVPIIVLGYTTKDEYGDLVKYDITQTVFKFSMAEEISKVASKIGKNAKIHIKLDTGMGRIGFLPNEKSIEEVVKISKLPNIDVEGIFTHFSKADEKDKSYTKYQLDKFKGFIEKLEKRNVKISKKHASNSAGIIDVKNAQFDMVRLGISLYGLYPSEEVKKENVELKPALSLVSNIIFIKEVEAGSYISYGGTYKTEKASKIATIPVGYGDGYARSLSSKGRVLIKGQYAPIVGRICMDQFMVDVTHIDNVEEGDEVILIGTQGGKSISVEELASHMNTINYEVICQLGKRIPRIYLKGKKPVYSIDYL